MRKFTWAILSGVAIMAAGCGSSDGGTGGGTGAVKGPGTTGGPVANVNAGREVTLRLKPAVGDKYSTHINMDMTVTPPAGQAGAQPMTMSMKVASNDEIVEVKDGKISIKSTITEAEGTGPMGATVGAMKGKVTTMVMDERGKMVNAGELAGNQAMSNPTPVFPEGPIKAGSTWKAQVEQNGQKVDADFKAVGIESVEGKEAMKIEMAVKVPQLQQPFVFTYFVDVSNGRLIKGSGNMDMEQQGAKMTMKMSMETKPL